MQGHVLSKIDKMLSGHVHVLVYKVPVYLKLKNCIYFNECNLCFVMFFQCSSLEQLNINAAQQHQQKHQPGTSTPKTSSSVSSGPSQTNLGASLSLLQQEQEQCNRER